jgi:hypothetical protein
VFEEILWPDGRVSLRCADLTYVCASESVDAVTANRVEPGQCERFSYVRVPAVPGQRRHSRSHRTHAFSR